MEGTLHKTVECWVVRYNIYDEPYDRELEVSPTSLSNPSLSTYWVEDRTVQFKINEWYAEILEDETWDDVFKNICNQDLVNFHDIWTWLKENYQTPKRR